MSHYFCDLSRYIDCNRHIYFDRLRRRCNSHIYFDTSRRNCNNHIYSITSWRSCNKHIYFVTSWRICNKHIYFDGSRRSCNRYICFITSRRSCNKDTRLLNGFQKRLHSQQRKPFVTRSPAELLPSCSNYRGKSHFHCYIFARQLQINESEMQTEIKRSIDVSSARGTMQQ